MCGTDHSHDHEHGQFGFLVDTPEIRALIGETKRLMSDTADPTTRVEALKPAFATLLSSDHWLPDRLAQPDEKSRMGDGIGQYALYRAEDGSLCLFSLVVPPGAFRPAPKVESAIARLVPLGAAKPLITDPTLFARVVAAAFGQRRKTLRNALSALCDEAALRRMGLDPGCRGETLPVGEFVRIANALAEAH